MSVAEPVAACSLGATQGPAARSTTDSSTSTCHVSVMTDPDCLGPCEPGTSIALEGIVWSESNNGQYYNDAAENLDHIVHFIVRVRALCTAA